MQVTTLEFTMYPHYTQGGDGESKPDSSFGKIITIEGRVGKHGSVAFYLSL